MTSVARTVVDLAAGMPLPEALVLLDAGSRLLVASLVSEPRRRDYTNERLVRATRELFIAAAPPRRIASLAATIAKADPCRESPAESLTAGHLYLSGLPMPVFQARIDTPFGPLYPDCYWPERRLVGECDGAVKYTGPDAVVAEKSREQWFLDNGYGVVRWQAREIMTVPSRVMARIQRALG